MKKGNKSVGKQVLWILKSRDWIDEDLASLLRVSSKSVARWRTGKAIPRRAAREHIEELFREKKQ